MFLVQKAFKLRINLSQPNMNIQIYESVNLFRENYKDITLKMDHKI